jgi:cyclopropane fatty-acyl-phospholipid synthase-like methyltransferase
MEVTTVMEKPFSQACENNKRPILDILKRAFAHTQQVLEIGSGTGQHASYLAAHLPHLTWHTSDQCEYHDGINAWISESSLSNLIQPVEFKVGVDPFPALPFDGIFSANTAHIMQKHEAKLLMELVSQKLPKGGTFCQYGPFTQSGIYSSQSNAEFHQSLVERGYGGYRDIDELEAWAKRLTLKEMITMPANNLMLVWTKE